ncbi:MULTISPECIES: pentaheme c-type cytochrome TorC [unclassified Agarivorans]|uniref:pentaheme c-type cytochrome TorC n=1 Tax=unclassified Agarivorans TaxID=2636026 RepID=UPI0026E33BC8|nr:MULTISPECIES: pentaheme c-type cytochrome TorC [unclassified Agarivorans]MDO6687840.1 pentaheme c-type cytochrome TorC [Agarivorans sp. 3_MG-2023]MDO6717462.1 pentaheme c-type cytochrome TorC [Agarivorans sp. 2_MG-2023]
MKNMLKKFWLIVSKPSVHLSFGFLTIGGFVAGIIFWGGFNTALEATNTEEFCIGCHEMADNVYVELQETVHWKNNSGVRATCPDCHVPHNWTDKIARKMQASKEVYGKIFGTISTREKFLEKRGELAQHEWDRFTANNSLECKNCHDYNSMDFDSMSERAQVQMKMAAERDQSCIDCHKGIAHELPDNMNSGEGTLAKLEEMATSGYKKGESYFSVRQLPLFTNPELNEEAGQLNAATKVKILEVKGDAIKVEIDAWRKTKGFGRVLFEDFAMNINDGYLTKEVAQAEGSMTKGETKEDDLTGLPWQKVSVELWMRNGSLTDSRDTLWTFAKTTYDSACSVCHTQPAENHFDTNTWPGMFNGMLSFVNLDGDTQALVLKYLQKHSSDFSDAGH